MCVIVTLTAWGPAFKVLQDPNGRLLRTVFHKVTIDNTEHLNVTLMDDLIKTVTRFENRELAEYAITKLRMENVAIAEFK